jgi:hypothetical protein
MDVVAGCACAWLSLNAAGSSRARPKRRRWDGARVALVAHLAAEQADGAAAKLRLHSHRHCDHGLRGPLEHAQLAHVALEGIVVHALDAPRVQDTVLAAGQGESGAATQCMYTMDAAGRVGDPPRTVGWL